MAESDGSVVISIDMNISDAQKELDRLSKRMLKLQEDFTKKSYEKSTLEKQLDDAQKKLADLEANAARTRFGTFFSAEDEQMAASLKEEQAQLAAQLEKVNNELAVTGPALETAKRYYGEFAQATQNLKDAQMQPDEEAQHLAEIAVNADIADQRIVDLVKELNGLKAQQSELQKAGVGLGYEQYDDLQQRIADINSELREYQQSLLGAGDAAKEAGNSAQNAAADMGLAAAFTGKFATRIAGLAKRVFVFSLVTAGLRALRSWLANVIQTNAQAQASLSQLKAAFLTLAQPILQVLIPALVFLLNILTRVVTMIASVVSKVFGTTLSGSAKSAQALYKANTGVGSTAGKASKSLDKEADAMKDVQEEAKEATKSLASFDEINALETDKPEEGIDDMADALNDLGGGGGGGIGGSGIPDFASIIKAQIDAILELFVGIALLALGAILTFTGANIPLGIGLMIIGALLIADAVTTNWNAIQEALQGPLGALLALIGLALLAVGAILTFSGANIPLGIALMAIGAAALATAVAVNWNTIQSALQGPLGELTAILSTALLVLGGLLAFSGVNVPLGIALIAIGAVGLAATAAANWETIVTLMSGPLGTLTMILSVALLVIGALLLFTAVNIPLGLGLMAVGAIGLAVALSPKWDTIQTILQGKIGAITAMVSAALLVLGIILVFTGVGIPIGLGMILAGAIGLAASVAANWDFILEKLKGAWEGIKNWWNSNVKNFVDPDWWMNLGKKMVDGLMEGLNNIFSKIGEWINGIKTRIQEGLSNIASGFGGGDTGASGVGRRSIAYDALPSIPITEVPALARGAVIPANREFLAVLGDQPSGTNVEAPLSMIEEALQNVLNRNGNGDINITFTGDLAQLARVLRPVIEREGKRIKGSLIEEAIA